MGWIIESLEKTGAPEPLLCVNVALLLSAVCTDCRDCAESKCSRLSSNMEIGPHNPPALTDSFVFCMRARRVHLGAT